MSVSAWQKASIRELNVHAEIHTTNLSPETNIWAVNTPPRRKSLYEMFADDLVTAQFIRVNSQLPVKPIMK